MQAAGLSEILQSRDEVNTAFAPTNKAFLTLEQRLNLTQSALFANKLLLTKVCSFNRKSCAHFLGHQIAHPTCML